MWLDPVIDNPWGHRTEILKLATINLSGYLVTCGLGLRDIGSQDDIDQAWAFVSYYANFAVRKEKLLMECATKCRQLIERHWGRIVALARAAEERQDMGAEEIADAISAA
jgi:hypothetical protein